MLQSRGEDLQSELKPTRSCLMLYVEQCMLVRKKCCHESNKAVISIPYEQGHDIKKSSLEFPEILIRCVED